MATTAPSPCIGSVDIATCSFDTATGVLLVKEVVFDQANVGGLVAILQSARPAIVRELVLHACYFRTGTAAAVMRLVSENAIAAVELFQASFEDEADRMEAAKALAAAPFMRHLKAGVSTDDAADIRFFRDTMTASEHITRVSLMGDGTSPATYPLVRTQDFGWSYRLTAITLQSLTFADAEDLFHLVSTLSGAPNLGLLALRRLRILQGEELLHPSIVDSLVWYALLKHTAPKAAFDHLVVAEHAMYLGGLPADTHDALLTAPFPAWVSRLKRLEVEREEFLEYAADAWVPSFLLQCRELRLLRLESVPGLSSEVIKSVTTNNSRTLETLILSNADALLEGDLRGVRPLEELRDLWLEGIGVEAFAALTPSAWLSETSLRLLRLSNINYFGGDASAMLARLRSAVERGWGTVGRLDLRIELPGSAAVADAAGFVRIPRLRRLTLFNFASSRTVESDAELWRAVAGNPHLRGLALVARGADSAPRLDFETARHLLTGAAPGAIEGLDDLAGAVLVETDGSTMTGDHLASLGAAFTAPGTIQTFLAEEPTSEALSKITTAYVSNAKVGQWILRSPADGSDLLATATLARRVLGFGPRPDWRQITRLSGIEDFACFPDVGGRTIVLLGEKHDDIGGCDTRWQADDPADAAAWVADVIRGSPPELCVDLYIEKEYLDRARDPTLAKGYTRPGLGYGGLLRLRLIMPELLSDAVIGSHVRGHNVDLRYLTDFAGALGRLEVRNFAVATAGYISRRFLEALLRPEVVDEDLDGLADAMVSQVAALDPTVTAQQYQLLSIEASQTVRQQREKLQKQLRRLDPELRGRLVEALVQSLGSQELSLFQVRGRIMDFYALARMLGDFDPEKDGGQRGPAGCRSGKQQLVIEFAGAAHTRYAKKVLTALGYVNEFAGSGLSLSRDQTCVRWDDPFDVLAGLVR